VADVADVDAVKEFVILDEQEDVDAVKEFVILDEQEDVEACEIGIDAADAVLGGATGLGNMLLAVEEGFDWVSVRPGLLIEEVLMPTTGSPGLLKGLRAPIFDTVLVPSPVMVPMILVASLTMLSTWFSMLATTEMGLAVCEKAVVGTVIDVSTPAFETSPLSKFSPPRTVLATVVTSLTIVVAINIVGSAFTSAAAPFDKAEAPSRTVGAAAAILVSTVVILPPTGKAPERLVTPSINSVINSPSTPPPTGPTSFTPFSVLKSLADLQGSANTIVLSPLSLNPPASLFSIWSWCRGTSWCKERARVAKLSPMETSVKTEMAIRQETVSK
jgi:hypothetical protein